MGFLGRIGRLLFRFRFIRQPDVLPAFSSLAKSFAINVKVKGASLGRYYAGLWSRHLLFNLLWNITGIERIARIKPYSAPTWSWVSVKGNVEHGWTSLMSAGKSEEFSISRIECIPKSDDPLGQISFGFLLAQACLWPLIPNSPGLRKEWGSTVIFDGVEYIFDDPAFFFEWN